MRTKPPPAKSQKTFKNLEKGITQYQVSFRRKMKSSTKRILSNENDSFFIVWGKWKKERKNPVPVLRKRGKEKKREGNREN